MLNAVYIELYKVFHKKNVYVFFGIILINALLLTYLLFAQKALDRGSFPLTLLRAMFTLLLPIFATILLGEIFSGEIRGGTLKILLTRPITRTQLLLSKFITLFLLISFLYTFTLAVGFGLGFFMPGTYLFKDVLNTIQIYYLSIIPMYAFTLFISIFALLIRKEGTLIALSLSFMYVSVIVGLVVTKVSPYLITTYFNVTDFLVKNPTLFQKDFWIGWGVVFGYTVIPILVGVWIFNRKDISG